jgi:hypothetical protein
MHNQTLDRRTGGRSQHVPLRGKRTHGGMYLREQFVRLVRDFDNIFSRIIHAAANPFWRIRQR